MERASFSLGTAGPGAQKNFDPEHPLARDSKGRSLALVLYLIQFAPVSFSIISVGWNCDSQ
jgi:hypothetical protein